MSSLLRSLRRRVNANPPPTKPAGKLHAGNIESVSIVGHAFPALESVHYTADELPMYRYPAGIAGLEAAARSLGVVGDRGRNR